MCWKHKCPNFWVDACTIISTPTAGFDKLPHKEITATVMAETTSGLASLTNCSIASLVLLREIGRKRPVEGLVLLPLSMSDTREQRVDRTTPQSTREVLVIGGPLPWQDWLMWKGCFGWYFHFQRICCTDLVDVRAKRWDAIIRNEYGIDSNIKLTTPRKCCFRCLTSLSVAPCSKVVVAVDSGNGGMGSEYDGTATKWRE